MFQFHINIFSTAAAAASVLYLDGSINIRYLSFHLMLLMTIGQDNDLSEFDESRDIIESLVDEYKACESPDYIKWGMEVGAFQPRFSFFVYLAYC